MRNVFKILPFFLVHSLCFGAEARQYDPRSMVSDDQLIVGVECDKSGKQIHIGLYPPAQVPKRKMDLWDTFDLKKNNADGTTVKAILSVTRSCYMGKQKYRIKISGAPGNWNMNGQCGALTYARAAVWRNGALIYDDNISGCEDLITPKLLIFRVGSDTPILRSGTDVTGR